MLNSFLQSGCGRAILREHDDSAGLAVEAARHVQPVDAEIFAAGANETRPWTMLRGMADHESGFVDHEEIAALAYDP